MYTYIYIYIYIYIHTYTHTHTLLIRPLLSIKEPVIHTVHSFDFHSVEYLFMFQRQPLLAWGLRGAEIWQN